jgi:hypothetical protein
MGVNRVTLGFKKEIKTKKERPTEVVIPAHTHADNISNSVDSKSKELLVVSNSSKIVSSNSSKSKSAKPRKKMGRPVKEIDQKLFERMCEQGILNQEDIANIFAMDTDTLCVWCKRNYAGSTYQEVSRALRGKRRTSFTKQLENHIFNTDANSGGLVNQQALIYYGKVVMGLMETQKIEANVNTSTTDSVILNLKNSRKIVEEDAEE